VVQAIALAAKEVIGRVGHRVTVQATGLKLENPLDDIVGDLL
jgi:hypothetical protein